MANRVILGKRGGSSDYGLYVSRDGVNVADSTSTTPLSFNADAANSLMVHSYGQGVLVPIEPTNASFAYGGVTYTAHDIEITHGLGFRPAYAVRWCRYPDISSGVATQVWSPSYRERIDFENCEEEEDGQEECDEYTRAGGIFAYANSNSPYKINIENMYFDDDEFTTTSIHSNGSSVVFYSYVIFNTEDFKNGESL